MTFSVRCSSGVRSTAGCDLGLESVWPLPVFAGLVVAGWFVVLGSAPRTTAKLPDPSTSEAAADAARREAASRRRYPLWAAVGLAADIKSSPDTDKAGTNRREAQSRTDSRSSQTSNSAVRRPESTAAWRAWERAS